MWPFDKDPYGLGDGIKRYRKWLKKWLLFSWKYMTVALIIFAIVVPIVHSTGQKNEQKASIASNLSAACIGTHAHSQNFEKIQALEISAPVSAVLKGSVEKVEQDKNLGSIVIIDHGEGWKTRYAYLENCQVKPGQQLQTGDLLGYLNRPHFTLLYNNRPVDQQLYK